MLVSYKWLKEYVDPAVDVTEFCDRMIMSGSNIETCTAFGEGIEKVLIGEIKEIKKHPDADKLVVCMIDVAEEELLQIVTGADNVYEGALVPVATHGSRIPGPLHGQPEKEGGVKIKKGKLRGVESFGMLCGAGELGFGDGVAPFKSKDGIWILPEEFRDCVGKPVDEAMEFKDYVIDFEITPNRPDCLSMAGMAREAGVTFDKEVTEPINSLKCEGEGNVEDMLSVSVSTDLCKRYTARIIKDIKIAESPWWMQRDLMAAGVRPINNIVDITNFVMLEYGQPLHAFDIRNVKGSKIEVATANDDEIFVTLDGEERELDKDTVVIKDSERAIALGGVMGGKNSGILDDTDTAVLESANFVRGNIRQTSKKLALRTEASSRFEKGIDPELAKAASDRFCHLVEELGAGKVVPGIIDVYPQKREPEEIDVRVSRINKVLGTEIEREEMERILNKLGCSVKGSGNIMEVTPPSVRLDLVAEVDFVEEIARIYGYDNLPMTLPRGRSASGASESYLLRNRTRDTLCAVGCDEITTFSFVSPSGMEKIGLGNTMESEFVRIINPLGEDTSVMRTMLLPQMMEVLARNRKRGVKDMKAYEIGSVFMPDFFDEKALPDEDFELSIGCYGEDGDFFALKGIIETLFAELGIKGAKFEAEEEFGIFHPGRCARITFKPDDEPFEIELGIMGEVHPDVAERYDFDGRCCMAELRLEFIEKYADRKVYVKAPPKYPEMERDIAMIVDEAVKIAEIEAAIDEAASEILREAKLFDIYRGKGIPEGRKSVAFNLKYRHDDRTLTDDETDAAHKKIVDSLVKKTGADIRDR